MQQAQTESEEVSSKHKEKLYFEGDRALEYAACTACGVPFSEEIPDLLGCGPGQPALDETS